MIKRVKVSLPVSVLNQVDGYAAVHGYDSRELLRRSLVVELALEEFFENHKSDKWKGAKFYV